MKPGTFGRCALLAFGLLLPQAASAQAQFHLMEATIDTPATTPALPGES